MTILEIKSEKIADAGKRANIGRELDALTGVLKPLVDRDAGAGAR